MVEFAPFEPAGTQKPWPVTTRAATQPDVPAIARPDKVVLVAQHQQDVAQHQEDVVGYATASLLDPEVAGGAAPRGWYLTGVVVDPRCRRHGVGRRLTAARLDALRGMASEVWYFVNDRNAASLALHDEFGFRLFTHDFRIPGVEFLGSRGMLLRAELQATRPPLRP